MSPERAKLILAAMGDRRRGDEGARCERMHDVISSEEYRYLVKLSERIPGCLGPEWALERIAAGPDGWRVGTVVQARRVQPGRHNRWIVAAGPMPPDHEDDVLLVDEECAELLDVANPAGLRGGCGGAGAAALEQGTRRECAPRRDARGLLPARGVRARAAPGAAVMKGKRKVRRPLKLFVWEDVLTDYTSGIMFALARDVEEARELIAPGYHERKKEEGFPDEMPDKDLQAEPVIHTRAAGFAVWGGG